MPGKSLIDRVPIIVALWFWILFIIIHLTYPDPITPEMGLSFFGLSTLPSGASNLTSMVLWEFLLLGLVICFTIQAVLLAKTSRLYSLFHALFAIGVIGVMFPFDKYKPVHDLGANVVYLISLIISIRISAYGLRHDYRKWVEMSIIGLTGLLAVIIILYIGFYVAILYMGGILQRIYLVLFFVLYSGFRLKTTQQEPKAASAA